MKRIVLSCSFATLLVACSQDRVAPPPGSELPCAAIEPAPCVCPGANAEPLSAQLMSLLSTARAYHHQADILLQQGEPEQAIEAVRAILALNLSSKWAEAEEARLDAVARLATLLAKQGRGDQAVALVERTLGGKARASFYLANLHSVHGELLEARAGRQRKKGRAGKARVVAKEAIAAFERSISLNKQLQSQLAQPPVTDTKASAGGKAPTDQEPSP